MNPLPWVGLVVSGLLAGGSLAGLLVVRRPYEILTVLSGFAGLTGIGLGVWGIAATNPSPSFLLAATAIGLAGCVGGFGLVSSLMANVHRCSNSTGRIHPSDPDTTAIIALADIEPPRYCPGDVTAEITELVDAGIPESGIGTTPFLYAAQKARYRAVGDSSPELRQAKALCELIDTMLDSERFSSVTLVACHDGQALASAVSSAIDAGHRSIIVASLHVAESFCIDREKGGVDALRLDPDEVCVSFTQPLWASDALADHVASRVLAVATDPDATGVALVMHGQPGAREHTHATFDVQETAFANRVKLALVDAGIPADAIRTCVQDWRAPDVTETVRHLAALGCSRVVVVPACFPFENLVTLLDLPVEIRQARVAEDVSVVQVAPWKDEEAVARLIAEEIVSVARLMPDAAGDDANDY